MEWDSQNPRKSTTSGTAFIALKATKKEGRDTKAFIFTAAHNIFRKTGALGPFNQHPQKLKLYLGKR